MKYLVHTWAAWQQNREDVEEILYNENVKMYHGWGIVRDEISKLAILPRGYHEVAALPEEEENWSWDELIKKYKGLLPTKPQI